MIQTKKPKPHSPTEHEVQSAFFDYKRTVKVNDPDWRAIFAVPNDSGAGQDSINRAKRVKAQGQENGVPDIFVMVARGGYFGLIIELKVPPNKPTGDQEKWILALRSNGYKAGALSTTDFMKIVEQVDRYLRLEPTPRKTNLI